MQIWSSFFPLKYEKSFQKREGGGLQESINKINPNQMRMKCLFPWSFILQVVLLQLYEQHKHFGYSRYNKSLIVSEPGLQMGQYVRTESCSILCEWKPVLPWRDGLGVFRSTLVCVCVSNSSTLSLVRVVLNRSRSGEGFWDMDRRLSQSNDPVALFFFPLGDAPSRGGDVSWKGGYCFFCCDVKQDGQKQFNLLLSTR